MNAEEFIAAETAQHQEAKGLNNSGLVPCEYKILIDPEEVDQVSAGGIVLATMTTEKEKQAQVRGRLIAVGGNAFEDWNEPIPKVGDHIWYAKYAGLVVKGDDGKEYRLANDKDCAAIVTGSAQ
jgi:co-chaperonin GroES (HSP10)